MSLRVYLLAGLSVFSVVACGSSDSTDESVDPTAGEASPTDEQEIKKAKPCGGIAGLLCPRGYTCVDDPRDACNPAKGGFDCIGYCKKGAPPPPPPPKMCGGFAGIRCPAGEICVDDPRDTCDPKTGGADCGGICQKAQLCGGFAGGGCPTGLTCVDDPDDSCDPAKGGRDCMGICQ